MHGSKMSNHMQRSRQQAKLSGAYKYMGKLETRIQQLESENASLKESLCMKMADHNGIQIDG